MVETAIETGMRWGELIALKPRHVDFLRRTITVEETIMEVSKRELPHRRNGSPKPYPKDNEPRTFAVRQTGSTRSPSTSSPQLDRDDLLFATTRGHPDLAQHLPHPRSGCPPSTPPGSTSTSAIHDLRHAHASWLLAGGSDLASVMDRLGHAQIQTTEKYLHTPADADAKNLSALDRIRSPRPDPPPERDG